jgi:hypothetical protein
MIAQIADSMKVTTALHPMPRPRMVELYFHSLIRLHVVVLGEIGSIWNLIFTRAIYFEDENLRFISFVPLRDANFLKMRNCFCNLMTTENLFVDLDDVV